MKPKSTARLVYEALLGTPSDVLSAYIFADVAGVYEHSRDTAPIPASAEATFINRC